MGRGTDQVAEGLEVTGADWLAQFFSGFGPVEGPGVEAGVEGPAFGGDFHGGAIMIGDVEGNVVARVAGYAEGWVGVEVAAHGFHESYGVAEGERGREELMPAEEFVGEPGAEMGARRGQSQRPWSRHLGKQAQIWAEGARWKQ